MASRREQDIDHILRRAGFGATQEEVDTYARLAFGGADASALARLLSYEQIADDVDDQIGKPGYVGITGAGRVPAGGQHHRRAPALAVPHGAHASARSRRRWRSSGTTTSPPATPRSPASSAPPKRRGCWRRSRPRIPAASRGSSSCSASTRSATSATCWSRSRRTRRCWSGSTAAPTSSAQPQENFARELMELFTMGVGTFAEADVYAGARVFTGWNLARPGGGAAQHYAFNYNAGAARHRRRRTFTFPIYPDGSTTIPARVGGVGHAGRPRSDQRRRAPSGDRAAARAQAVRLLRQRGRRRRTTALDRPRWRSVYYAQRLRDRSRWCGVLLLSPQFRDPANYYKRYSWPVEFVVAVAEGSRLGRLLGERRADAAVNMGQQLFEPPDVNGWELGPGWFSSGGMLARMNFAAQLATNQKFDLRDVARGHARHAGGAARATCSIGSRRRSTAATSLRRAARLRARRRRTGPASDAQLATKAAGPRAPDRRVRRLSVRLASQQCSHANHTDASSSGAASRRSPSASRRRRSCPISRSRRAVAAQSRRPLSERRQRRAQHAHPVHRPAVLRAASDARDPGGATCCRSAPTRRRNAAGPEPAAHRAADDLQRRPPRDHPAHRLRRTRAARISRAPTSGRPANPVVAAGPRLARALSRHAAVAGRSADGVVHGPRDAAHAARADASACPRFPSVAGVRVRQPQRRHADAPLARATSATRIASHLPVDQPHLAFVNATAQAAFATLDRVAQVGTYVPDGHLSEQRPRAGAARGRRRDGQAASARACSGCRPAATTRTPARTPNHANGTVHRR